VNYEEAIAFLESRIRWGMRPGTERVSALVEALDHPQRAYPVVHVSGTNGKYSVSAMVTAILTELGLTVGTYTSPHLESVRERIAIGGEPIDEDGFAGVLSYLEPYIDLVEKERDEAVTYFELLTIMAFEAFFDRPVHAAVLEAGLGGEYDATNVADAKVAVLTNVSLDHVRQFGSDLRKAAWEKAGIVKEGSAVVAGLEQDDLFEILVERVQERRGQHPIRLGVDIDLLGRRPAVGGQVVTISGLHDTYEEVFLSLFGSHQARNAALAVAACEAFAEERLNDEALRTALGAITTPGRMEVLGRHPLVICDGAHNPAAARAVREALEESFTYERLTIVAGVLEDKLISDVLAAFAPIAAHWVVTRADAERAADPDRLVEALEASGVDRVSIDVVVPVPDAVQTALDTVTPDDAVLVMGSFTTVGEARSWLRSR
jgi:dihydrofolate synthase/folylpolyglutamate synthase